MVNCTFHARPEYKHLLVWKCFPCFFKEFTFLPLMLVYLSCCFYLSVNHQSECVHDLYLWAKILCSVMAHYQICLKDSLDQYLRKCFWWNSLDFIVAVSFYAKLFLQQSSYVYLALALLIAHYKEWTQRHIQNLVKTVR